MDPNATLAAIEVELRSNDTDQDELDEHCENLKTWLENGGYRPSWDSYPRASDYYFKVGEFHI